MTFGEKLQKLRAREGLSQERLAEELGVSRQAVSKWERDETLPETEKVVRISDYFGVSLDYLLKDVPPEESKSAAVPWIIAQTIRLYRKHGYLCGIPMILYAIYRVGRLFWFSWEMFSERYDIWGFLFTLFPSVTLDALVYFLVGLWVLFWGHSRHLRWYDVGVPFVLWGSGRLLVQELWRYLFLLITPGLGPPYTNALIETITERHAIFYLQPLTAILAGAAILLTGLHLTKRGR